MKNSFLNDFKQEKNFNIPNLLSLLRLIAAAPVISYGIVSGQDNLAALVYIGAAITDFIDGYVARRFEQKTKLGSFLDPLADKILTILPLLLLWWQNRLPGYTVMPIVLAEIIVAIGVAAVIGTARESIFNVTKFGKWKAAILFSATSYNLLDWPYSQAFMAFAAVLAVASAGHYFIRFRRDLKKNQKGANHKG